MKQDDAGDKADKENQHYAGQYQSQSKVAFFLFRRSHVCAF